MPANVGQMFYYGEVPWHREGEKVERPLTVEEALLEGALNWEVGKVDLCTAENCPSPASMRQAVVRLDRPSGHVDRVLGVVHRDFRPLQNREGAKMFDRLVGNGKAVYHTGGYLGEGEVVWLMAKINQPLEVGTGDFVEPYALFANSHDGSRAVSMCLTTVRVVCQNTLNLALDRKAIGAQFRRAHQGSVEDHEAAAKVFWISIADQIKRTKEQFEKLATTRCRPEHLTRVLDAILPRLTPPYASTIDRRWSERAEEARKTVTTLCETGKGAEFSKGSLWGVLNAVTEYVDHHKWKRGATISRTLFGSGMNTKK